MQNNLCIQKKDPGTKRIPHESYWNSLSIKLSIYIRVESDLHAVAQIFLQMSVIPSVSLMKSRYFHSNLSAGQSTEYTRKSIIHIPHSFIHLSARYKTLKCFNTALFGFGVFWGFFPNIKVKEETNISERLCLTRTLTFWGHFIIYIIFLSSTMIPWTGIALMLMRIIKHSSIFKLL